jgi:hypothetical protein
MRRLLSLAVPAATVLLAGLVAGIAPNRAQALDELKHEKKAISACERTLCNMLVTKQASGPDLKCDLTKTWGKKTIKSAESSTLSWAFGDARCTVKIDVRRAEILQAISASKAKFWLPDQRVHCIVEENGKPQDVHVLVSPKIEFRDGRAEKIWINLKEAEGPESVVGLVRLAVNMSDKVGILHPGLVKSVNGFINKSCPKVLATPEEVAEAAPPPAAPKPPRKKPAASEPAKSGAAPN